jgi:hypothetical protein
MQRDDRLRSEEFRDNDEALSLIALQFCNIFRLFVGLRRWPLCNLPLSPFLSPRLRAFNFPTCRDHPNGPVVASDACVGGNSVKIIRRLDKRRFREKGFFVVRFWCVSSSSLSLTPQRPCIRPINSNLMAFRNVHRDFHLAFVA